MTLVTETSELKKVAEEIRRQGRFVFDLEFASDGRYLPELALMQLAWGNPDAPEIALVECIEKDLSSIYELMNDPEVLTIGHAAKQDLEILAWQHGVEMRGFIDTQIACAFLGLGEQIGLGGMVSELLKIELDKGAQFTNWLRRPLSDRQLVYAQGDVEHLLACWNILQEKLTTLGRFEWVKEESKELCAQTLKPMEPRDTWVKIKGIRRVKGRAFAIAAELAAWRYGVMLKENKPRSWVLSDPSLLSIAKMQPKGKGGLRDIGGMKDKTIRLYGDAILECVRNPRDFKAPRGTRVKPLSSSQQIQATVAGGILQHCCRQHKMAARLVGNRDDLEGLIRWKSGGGDEPDSRLLQGWRREMAGQTILDWLDGKLTIRCEKPLRLEEA